MDIFEEIEKNEMEEEENPEKDEEKLEKEEEKPERVPVPKRLIKNPRVKFNAEKLCGERGIPILVDHFKDAKFKGKGHEAEDLNKLMSSLEHWCHRLFPSLRFRDCLHQIERLGKKRPVQTCLHKIRLDMPILSNDFISEEPDDVNREDSAKEPNINDAFDSLFDVPISCSTPINSQAAHNGSKLSSLTEEQKQKMEHNKKLALERRNARLARTESTTECAQTSYTLPVNDCASPGDITESNLASTKTSFDSLLSTKFHKDETMQLFGQELPSVTHNNEFATTSQKDAPPDTMHFDDSAMSDNYLIDVQAAGSSMPKSTDTEFSSKSINNIHHLTTNQDNTTQVIENSEELELDALMDLVGDDDD